MILNYIFTISVTLGFFITSSAALAGTFTSMDYATCWKTVEKKITKDVKMKSLAYVGTVDSYSQEGTYHVFNLEAAVHCMKAPRGQNGIYFLNSNCSEVVGVENFQGDATAYRVDGKTIFLSNSDNNYHLLGANGKGEGAPGEGNVLDLQSGWKDRKLFQKFDYGVTGGFVLEKENKNTNKKELTEYHKQFCKTNTKAQ